MARARRESRAILGLGLLTITFGVALIVSASTSTLDWTGVALIVLGIPTAVLGDARLGRLAATGRAGPYATGADAGFGWGFADGGGWPGGDCGGFGGGGGDGGGGGC